MRRSTSSGVAIVLTRAAKSDNGVIGYLPFSASHSYDWLATGIFHAIARGVLCDKVVYYVRSFNCFLMILYLRFFASPDRR